MLIEEDDVFKFNCHDMRPDDFLSLQLVAFADELPAEHADKDDKMKLEFQRRYKQCANDQGLLILAKSDLKLSYLM